MTKYVRYIQSIGLSHNRIRKKLKLVLESLNDSKLIPQYQLQICYFCDWKKCVFNFYLRVTMLIRNGFNYKIKSNCVFHLWHWCPQKNALLQAKVTSPLKSQNCRLASYTLYIVIYSICIHWHRSIHTACDHYMNSFPFFCISKAKAPEVS